VRFRRQEERLGGAANVANNCVHLGARTRLGEVGKGVTDDHFVSH